jgi:hypothetical protein
MSFLDNTQTVGPEKPPAKPNHLRPTNPRLPGYVMQSTEQAFCDRKGQANALALKYSCHVQAFSDNEMEKVSERAWNNRRPVKGRDGQMKMLPNRKYRFRMSYYERKIYRHLKSIYTPDCRNHIKYYNSFDGYGRVKVTAEDISVTLRIPLRTVQRELVTLDAMRLLDRIWIPSKTDENTYVGSQSYLYLRLDIYLQIFDQLKEERESGESRENRLGTPCEMREQSPVESTISEAHRDDNIVTCNTVTMETPSSSPKPVIDSGLVFEKGEPEEPFGSDNLSLCKDITTFGQNPCVPGNESCVPDILREDVLTFGDDLFRKFTSEIDTHYPGQLNENPKLLLQLRYWILRPSPKERMSFDDLHDVLSDNRASSVKNLLEYWPLILRLYRVEQIECAGGYDADETIKSCSESVAPKDFVERMNYQVGQIIQRSFRETSPVRLGTYDPWFDAPGDRFALLAACSELGLTYSVDTVLDDPERLKQLREYARTNDFEALTFQHHYPQLANRFGFEKYDWNQMKRRIRKGYEQLLHNKAQAEMWN